MLPRTGLSPVPCLFGGPVEGFPSQTLCCSRHECTFILPNPIVRNFSPPGTARHVRNYSGVPCCAVDYRLHWFDKRRIHRGKNDFARNFNGHARGKPHEHEFWKCCNGIQQSPDPDPVKHRHFASHYFPGKFHRCGFRSRGRNVFGFHRCWPEQLLSNPVCTDDRWKRFRKHVHRQQCHKFSADDCT